MKQIEAQAESAKAVADAGAGRLGGFRWVVCALLFFATTINYIDRQILSLLKEILDHQIGWTNEQFGLVNSAFQFAYGLGLLGSVVRSIPRHAWPDHGFDPQTTPL